MFFLITCYSLAKQCSQLNDAMINLPDGHQAGLVSMKTIVYFVLLQNHPPLSDLTVPLIHTPGFPVK
ncbi:hypothetical protein T08_9254 [Trichinella sp. T8]|nr:hypothetical protein T08_9254 [Trichinella sp. T8]